MKQSVPEKFSREMGLTVDEFLRTLPAAIKPLNFVLRGNAISIAHEQGAILINLHPTGERRIASICLPVTRVDFDFTGIQSDERSMFMQRFELYFHRGGG